MAERRYSRAVAVITTIWLLASAAVLTLATADTDAAQPGCGGGASSSSSGSASPSGGGGGGGLPTNVTTILPLPGQSSSGGSASPSGSRSPSGSASSEAPGKEIPVATAQEISCRSTVTIAYAGGQAPKFSGKVGSGEPMCRRARDVTVKKVKRGPDRPVGKAVTNAKGKYSVAARNAKGKYYAQVAKATVENGDGNTVTCRPAKSERIKV